MSKSPDLNRNYLLLIMAVQKTDLFFVVLKVPIIRAFFYVAAQCAGAIAGSAILRALSAERMEGVLGVVGLAEGVTPVQGLGIEFFLALILVIVVCGACDAAKPESKGVAPLIIGLAVTVGHLVGVRMIKFRSLEFHAKIIIVCYFYVYNFFYQFRFHELGQG